MSVPTPAPERTVNGALWVAIIVLGVLQVWPIVAPYLPHPDPLVAVGKAYRAPLAQSYAASWEAAAKVVEAGGKVADAQAALQAAWLKGRTDSFNARVAPALAKVLPEGQEPDSATRPKVVAAWQGFARGLRHK